MTDSTIILNIADLTCDDIPKLLEEKDILTKIEEGTNSTSTTKVNEQIKPSVQLENYINLKGILDINY